MKFRFSKRIKIAPGVRLNISKSGISTTLGGRGASVNLGKKGTHVNASIPKTGISVRKKIGGGKRTREVEAKKPKIPEVIKNSTEQKPVSTFSKVMTIAGIIAICYYFFT